VHNIRLEMNIAYRAVVLSSLLYCCESWCLYRRQLRKLEQFHMRCLWNIDMLERCQSDSIEATLVKHQFRWVGYVIRMPDTPLPMRIFYGQLPGGGRSQGGQLLRYKDVLKRNLKACDIPAKSLESLAQDRSLWRTTSRGAVAASETSRTDHLRQVCDRCKARTVQQRVDGLQCRTCVRLCGSRIGLFAHERSHRKMD